MDFKARPLAPSTASILFRGDFQDRSLAPCTASIQRIEDLLEFSAQARLEIKDKHSIPGKKSFVPQAVIFKNLKVKNKIKNKIKI